FLRLSMYFVDGSKNEGGGQIVRNSIVLAALLQQNLTIENIRRGRPKPGLKNQHLEGINFLGDLCDAELTGNALNSLEVTFSPSKVPAEELSLRSHYTVALRTPGAVTLLMQISMPFLLLVKKPMNF